MLELGGILILGILAQWVAWRLKIPAILPLILIGLLVGPISTLITEDGTKWIEPVWNGNNNGGLFPRERLFNLVSLAISIILFEGGLTLKKEEILNVGPVILKLITLGSLVTFVGAGVSAHYIFDLSWSISFLFAGLIIVTGPTVIAPILRNIPLKRDVSAVLKWEGILIDPVGALVAVLVFEFIIAGEGGNFTKEALIEFGKIVFYGTTIGVASAYTLFYSIKWKLIPHYLMNVVVLAIVLAVFVLSDALAHESGLLSVVIMGLMLGNMDVKEIKEILHFKESLSLLLISLLFILLSANINISDLMLLYNWKTILLFVVVVFILRPLSVFLSTTNSTLTTNEKLFISWVGPRGIVAAGIASLFGLKLIMLKEPGAEYITPLVFMIVLGTVVLNATTARAFAKIIGVFLKTSDGILIVGASKVSILIASYLKQKNRHVVLIDSNPDHVNKAKKFGLEAFGVNIYESDLSENIEFNDIAYLMALTGSSTVNKYALNKFSDNFGNKGAFRLISSDEMKELGDNPEKSLLSYTDDFINLSEVVRDYPEVNEIELKSHEHYSDIISLLNKEVHSIPVFVKDNNGKIYTIPLYSEINVEAGHKLMYLGKKIELEFNNN
ncbi:MAG: sodium:proton antiporter [Tenacibaculum sp.]|nr:sodium:proton antiporter [Tenacibaculum sp.]